MRKKNNWQSSVNYQTGNVWKSQGGKKQTLLHRPFLGHIRSWILMQVTDFNIWAGWVCKLSFPPLIHTFSLYLSSHLCFKITTFPPLSVWNQHFVTAFNHTYMCECKEELCTAKLTNANTFKGKKINLAVIFLCSLLLTMIFVLPLLAELPLQQIHNCKCIGFVWTGFGNERTTGLTSLRSC